ncbi:hypothetical protein CEXT_748711 [Caerostris extrusa]|uniref:Uncharacterized protein n=1 Tax=Caerostris extrusa TaxID=172846 RepID=A0AAV4NI87_CAEEX|nr:hypothetical protein CEXT_748711 [Caerostris extrusa]
MNATKCYSSDFNTYSEGILCFADNITSLMTSATGIPWKKVCNNDGNYQIFCRKYKDTILNKLSDEESVWYLTLENDPLLWTVSEDAFLKFVHPLRHKAKSSPPNEVLLIQLSYLVLYAAVSFYHRGLKKAPVLAFSEIICIANLIYPDGGFACEM